MTGDIFLDERRLIDGPWQAFERDIARALIMSGFEDVRLIGGTGDRGADILAVKSGQVWVVQCKHTTSKPPPKEAVEEIVRAGRFYSADRLFVATSRPPGNSFQEEVARYKRLGISVETLDPSTIRNLLERVPEYA